VCCSMLLIVVGSRVSRCCGCGWWMDRLRWVFMCVVVCDGEVWQFPVSFAVVVLVYG